MPEIARPVTSDQVAPLLATALCRSAQEGARVVALHWLHALVTARDEWHAADADACVDPIVARQSVAATLHRARVALRRLRSTLREHRGTLAIDEGRRIRRALRRLGDATNAVRDRDVQCAWLTAGRDALPEAARAEADSMLREFEDAAQSGPRTVSRAFARHGDPHLARLERRLKTYWLKQTVGADGSRVPFARYLAQRLELAGARVERDLGRVHDQHAERLLHRIRIRLKRQRAMLAPFASAHPDIAAWYAAATDGQDVLGAMRDASVLAAQAHQRNFDALALVLRSTARAHFEIFRDRWCDAADTRTPLHANAVRALQTLADGHATRAPLTADVSRTGLPAGHGLPMEIERKFLLHGLPPHAAMTPSHRIEQGWLPGTMLRERLRRSLAPNGDERLTRTIKLGPPGERIEVEEPTEPGLFAAMWPLTVGARIRKRRHAVRDAALTWEVDVFLDRDLVLAEVELDDVAQVVDIPAWLSPFIVREVTQETAYLNSVMARPDAAAPDRGAH